MNNFSQLNEVKWGVNLKKPTKNRGFTLIELIIAFEVEFDIEIPENDAEKLLTLKDIYDYIKKRIDIA